MKKRFKKKMDKIAVVGMAGVFPQAKNITEFLTNILEKKNSIVTVPSSRWIDPASDFIAQHPMPDKAICDQVGCIEHFDFDPAGFQIDSALLSELDPVHQLVLQAGREAFLQCAHSKESQKRTGVILAAIALPTHFASSFSRQVLFGKNLNSISAVDVSRTGVVSYPAAVLGRAMGFEAGSFTLDAACASSLVSIKLACEHLSLRKADIMLAGGVSRPSSLYTQIGFTQLQALSPSGKCSPFDSKADGLIVGEGTGIVALKRLEDAVLSNDTIHAVITGTGLSNDIDGTLVGPASEGQIRAMCAAYDQAEWSPENIQYMECHGSGTSVGDQVELTSIKTLLDMYDCPEKFLAIGSVKSMIGHLLTAAGAAGFIKTIMSMNRGVLPPSLNFSSPSDKSPINYSHINVQTQVEDWVPASPAETRKAGISAFGFGGINAHLLVEEFQPGSRIYPVSPKKEPDEFKVVPCAIVGMETIVKDCDSLQQFKQVLFDNKKIHPDVPDVRWKRSSKDILDSAPGLYLDELKIELGQFHIPPNQMDDILVQHMLLLKAAYGSLLDANIPPRPSEGTAMRERFGCAIGIDFDYGATDFHLRWQLNHLDNDIKNQVSKPLTFNRTLGALGGIVASRVAREFKLGGPCFTVSAGEASGIKAIETAIHSLSAYETNTFVCGCVDLSGDIRPSVLTNIITRPDEIDIPSEGSAAIVLKRYDQAIEDGDKIYGVLTGIGSSGGDAIPGESHYRKGLSEQLYVQSLESALQHSNSSFDDIGLYASSLNTQVRSSERAVLDQLFLNLSDPCSMRVNAVSSAIGKTGAVSAMFSVIQAALSLDLKLLPSGEGKTQGEDWIHSDPVKPRKACVASITTDGTCAHAIMEEHVNQGQAVNFVSKDKKRIEIKNQFHSGKNFILKTNPLPIVEDVLWKIQNHLDLDLSRPGIQEKAVLHPHEKKQMVLDPSLITKGNAATANAHEKFLEFSQVNMGAFEKQFKTLTQLAGNVLMQVDNLGNSSRENLNVASEQLTHPSVKKVPYLDRDMCLEYAEGKAGNVLGPEFDIIDTYPVRVRLPAEPLMLVDRIMDIQGEKLSLGPGKIVTQHDVKAGSWYLDGPKAPVSISIEAGQADLFLCAWLGIDHQIKGKRKYRLLDAKVTFHRTLPEPGETIEYHIEIDRFLKQGDVYLFFFHYQGYIDEELMISMRDGCAGFFTEEEVENSGGIILKFEETKKIQADKHVAPLVPVEKQSFSDDQIQALRSGDLPKAFGEQFKDKILGKYLQLPGGKMHLIDRVLEFDPQGGRFGLGSIIAQSDIHPDAWFLTCHFIDDMVMPGTLMYECCAHALRVFTQRIGWVTDRNDVYYDVLPHNEADLKCRGPVTRETRHARYEIEIKDIGYGPEPYVIADAHMFSDDLRIVLYKDMGLKLVGLTKDELERFWRKE